MGNILSLIGWTFLPNLVTSWVQSIYYSLTIRAGTPHPRPGTPRHTTHRRRIHILVVSLYLLYTLYEADWELRRSGSFFTDLGVLPTATEREIKTRFRRLAALNHPDKTSTSSSNSQEDATARFIHLKLASETLLEPARRFAYERFGPTVVTSTPTWQQAGCITLRDHVHRGLTSVVLPRYAVAAGVMYLLGFLGYLDGPGGPGGGGAGRIWRWLVWAACLVLEYHVATRPGDRILWGLLEGAINPLLSRFTTHPPLVPFQLVALVRQCSVVTYIAMAQLGPAVAAEMEWQRQRHGGGGGQAASMAQASGSAADQELLLRRGLDALEQQVKVLGVDADRMLALELAPFAGDDDAMRDVGVAARRWLVQNTVRSDPMVRDAIGRSRQRRRADAPAGARGNR